MHLALAHVIAATGHWFIYGVRAQFVYSLGDRLSWFPQEGRVFWDRGLPLLQPGWSLTFIH